MSLLKIIFFFVISFLMICCSQEREIIIEGDLYQKLVNIKIFELPDSTLNKIENDFLRLTKSERKNEIARFYIDNKIFRTPFIRLRNDEGKLITLLLNSKEYNHFKEIDFSKMRKENKKMRIKAKVRMLQCDTLIFYQNIEIISINKIQGKTYSEK